MLMTLLPQVTRLTVETGRSHGTMLSSSTLSTYLSKRIGGEFLTSKPSRSPLCTFMRTSWFLPRSAEGCAFASERCGRHQRGLRSLSTRATRIPRRPQEESKGSTYEEAPDGFEVGIAPEGRSNRRHRASSFTAVRLILNSG